MAQDLPYPVRKSHRLPMPLYSLPGAYFVTICAWHRRLLFGSISRAGVALSPLGQLVKRCWENVPSYFELAELDLFVVMPNHFHAVVFIRPGTRPLPASALVNDPVRAALRPAAAGAFVHGEQRLATLPSIVKSFKASVTRQARHELGTAEQVWQASYWDHVVRDDDELYQIRQYIINNPLAWELDRDNAARSGLHPFYEWIEARRIPASQKQN